MQAVDMGVELEIPDLKAPPQYFYDHPPPTIINPHVLKSAARKGVWKSIQAW